MEIVSEIGVTGETHYWTVCNLASLRQAHQIVASRHGADTPGIDGETTVDWAQGEKLDLLHQGLLDGTYEPLPSRACHIRKPGGGVRLLGIPAFRDRIVQQAVRAAIEPIFEEIFLDCSYGYRPGRNTWMAVEAVTKGVVEGNPWVVKVDIAGCFDNFDHQPLLAAVRERIDDDKCIGLCGQWLNAGKVLQDGSWKATEAGTPQGGVISPLLANIYLHALDVFVQEKAVGAYARYADDLIVLCATRAEAEDLRNNLLIFLQDELHLQTTPSKTVVCHIDGGIDFLGFRLFRDDGQSGIAIPRDAKEGILGKIDTIMSECWHFNPSRVRKELNAVLRGWGGYSKNVPSRLPVFRNIDGQVDRQWKRYLRSRSMETRPISLEAMFS